MASNLNCIRLLCMWFITLAISYNTIFFLLATPFCWGDIEVENSCLIPYDSQKRSTSTLSNSLPLSLIIIAIGWPISSFIILNNDFKCSMALDFSLKKLTKVKKSSTTTRTYLLLPLFSVHIRPRFMWRRSKGLVAFISLTFLCEP